MKPNGFINIKTEREKRYVYLLVTKQYWKPTAILSKILDWVLSLTMTTVNSCNVFSRNYSVCKNPISFFFLAP